MFTIHVFTPGENVFEVYLKVQRHYPVSKVILLQDENAPRSVQDSINKVAEDCGLRSLPKKVCPFGTSAPEQEVETIIKIRKKYPDAQLFFNITAGKKDYAIIAFMASVWVNGICYYWPKEKDEPLEFPVPKVSIKELAENRLHMEIIGILTKKSKLKQSEIRETIEKNPNNNAELSPQTLSQSLKYLKRYGLVDMERNGRDTLVSLTLSGKLAYSMVYT